MKLLALETANEQCSVCIVNDTQILFNVLNDQTRMQTQMLLPMVEQGLQTCQLTCDELTAIAFSRGPGSFSGVRINAAVTQALAWANDLPVVPVSTLQALAQAAYRLHGLTAVTAVLDARMQEVYIANFELDEQHIMQLKDTEQMLSYADAAAQVQYPLVGSGALLVDDTAIFSDVKPTAEDIAVLGTYFVNEQQWVSAEHALPIYLRDNAWKKIAEQGKQ